MTGPAAGLHQCGELAPRGPGDGAKAVDGGVLRGDQGGGLRLTDDNLVNLQMLRNLGLLDGGGA